MEYSICNLINNIYKQHDALRAPFLKCNTVKELKKAIKPHVERIYHKYDHSCYGTTSDSVKNELYDLMLSVSHVSKFGMTTINRVTDDILDSLIYEQWDILIILYKLNVIYGLNQIPVLDKF